MQDQKRVHIAHSIKLSQQQVDHDRVAQYLTHARREFLALTEQAYQLHKSGTFGGIHFAMEVAGQEEVRFRGSGLPDVEVVAEICHEDWREKKRSAGVTSRTCAEDGSELMVPYSQLTETGKELNRAPVRLVYEAIAAAKGFQVA